jgi:RHS repeat-associated protein
VSWLLVAALSAALTVIGVLAQPVVARQTVSDARSIAAAHQSSRRSPRADMPLLRGNFLTQERSAVYGGHRGRVSFERVRGREKESRVKSASTTLAGWALGLLLAAVLLGVARQAAAQACVGDCNGNREVPINEIIRAVNIALGNAPLEQCPAIDRNANREVTIDELIGAVRAALNGCPPAPSSTATPPATATAPRPTLTVAPPTATVPQPTATPIATTPTGGMVTPTGTLPAVTTLLESSPANGEGGVAVSRETIVRFSGALDPATVTEEAIYASFGGERFGDTRYVSADGATVTVFYARPFLPASARVRVTVDGARLRDRAGRPVDADGDGVPGGVGVIEFDTLTITTLPGTIVCGRVFASELAAMGGGSVNQPLAGVIVTVDGQEPTMRAVTDELGDFRLDPAPAGRFFVHIDGRSATAEVPAGAYYPVVGKAWEAVPGVETNIGEIYLPLITEGTLQPVSASEATVVTFPDAVLAEHPELSGVQITVPPGSLFTEGGQTEGMVGIAPVPPDRLPGVPPLGLDFPIVITVQSDVGSNFDAPVAACFPNLPLPETGQPLAPGAKSALWSFNHDTGRWEMQGSMTVTADGRLVCTDPGVGINAPGWHGSRPGTNIDDGNIDDGDPDPDPPPKDDPPAKPGGCENGDCAAWLKNTFGGMWREAAQAMGIDLPGTDNNDDSGGGIGDPVYGYSGEFYEQVEDLRIKSRGFDFVWTRTYRSKVGPNTAQGNGWDFSYNVFVEPTAADLRLCDGRGRVDDFPLRAVSQVTASPAGGRIAVEVSSRWTRREFFEDLVCQCSGPACAARCGGGGAATVPPPVGTLPAIVHTFPDGGFWEYHPFEDSPSAGKLRRSVDRNGNAMQFGYDAMGRLTTVTDTLGRDVTIAYNGDGLIASLTDFTGRQVLYTYYGADESGGSPRDLKTVTTMAVTGTPNGNDFPQGKTWTYTYSRGFQDERLNHNLLTITDPKGQTYLRNLYASTTDPADLNFDRVVGQQWGNPGENLAFTYVSQTPSEQNGRAVIKTIVRDRVGNVQEHFYDARNREVMLDQYTGRASIAQPTTEFANRPQNRLRADDPPFFRTSYSYNNDSLLSRIVHPNGNVTEYVYEGDLNRDAPPRKRGDLRIIRRRPGTHAPVGDQAMLEERYEYDPRFGGMEFVTDHTDARGNHTRHVYDDRGNRTRSTHRLPAIVEDVVYNEFGQPTRVDQPPNDSGHRRRDTFSYYDTGPQRGYLRQRIVDDGGFGLTDTYEYDAVGNVVRVIDPRGHDTQFVVNQRDQIVRTLSREVIDQSGVRYQVDTAYDANDKVTRVDVQNVDDTGSLQANTHFTGTITYDILNFPVRATREVDATHVIVTETVYDANRNPIRRRKGEAVNGNQPSNVTAIAYDERDLVYQVRRAPGAAEQSTTQTDYDGNGNVRRVARGIESTARVTSRIHDAYDRPVRSTDPMGNEARRSYDPNDNLVAEERRGERDDVEGGNGNVRLTALAMVFDVMDRPTRVDASFYDTATQTAVGDGNATTTSEYAPTSQIVRTVNDNGHATTWSYDTANRMARVTDAKANVFEVEYDANSNIIRTTETDKSDLGRGNEVFVTRHTYDGLDRLVETIDNGGNTLRSAYDSRGNAVRRVDAKGNVVRMGFDGADRVTEVVRELRSTGDGTGTIVDAIRVGLAWDDNSRLVSQTDDLGNATSYSYDPLDRMIAATMADGTRSETVYDAHDSVRQMRAASGSVVDVTYDLLDRPIRRVATPGTGVASDTTFQEFAYDGLSRFVRVSDDDSTIVRDYDSLSNLVRETLDGRTTATSFDGQGNALTLTYPSGRRITHTYDALERLKTVADAEGEIARFDYIGPRRPERHSFGNGTSTSFAYDDVRRMTRLTHARAGAAFDDRGYGWDAMYRKTTVTDHLGGTVSEITRDSVYRVVRTVHTPMNGPVRTIDYAIDGVQNRSSVTGGPDAGEYARDATAPEPADRQLNQYTTTPFDARRYDDNGNLTVVDPAQPVQRLMTYDVDDRMVSWAGSGRQARYRYDAFGRRIAKTVDGVTTRFFFDGMREIEEQDGAGATQATYVYGQYVDEPLTMRRNGATFFYAADQLYSITAVTDAGGVLVEAYDYDDFGVPSVRDGSGQPLPSSQIGNPLLFTGRRFDGETGWYHLRNRYLDPRAGRFISRDPLGTWGDATNLGNSYAYVGNDPFTHTDPFGLGPGEGEAQDWWANYAKLVFDGLEGDNRAAAITSARNELGYDILTKLPLTPGEKLEQLGILNEMEKAGFNVPGTRPQSTLPKRVKLSEPIENPLQDPSHLIPEEQAKAQADALRNFHNKYRGQGDSIEPFRKSIYKRPRGFGGSGGFLTPCGVLKGLGVLATLVGGKFLYDEWQETMAQHGSARGTVMTAVRAADPSMGVAEAFAMGASEDPGFRQFVFDFPNRSSDPAWLIHALREVGSGESSPRRFLPYPNGRPPHFNR